MSPQPVDSAQEFSLLEEMELKERIRMLEDQEKALRDERQLLESRLRNLILARYAERVRYGVEGNPTGLTWNGECLCYNDYAGKKIRKIKLG